MFTKLNRIVNTSNYENKNSNNDHSFGEIISNYVTVHEYSLFDLILTMHSVRSLFTCFFSCLFYTFTFAYLGLLIYYSHSKSLLWMFLSEYINLYYFFINYFCISAVYYHNQFLLHLFLIWNVYYCISLSNTDFF